VSSVEGRWKVLVMMSMQQRRRAALVAAAAVGVLLASAPVAAHATRTFPGAKPPAPGFFVTGAGRVTSSPDPSALLRDPAGRLHVVTTVRDPSVSGDRGRIVYSTKKLGAKHWVRHVVPGLRPLAGGVHVEELLNGSANHLFVVFYECDGVFASEVSLSSSRLTEPSRVQATDRCSTATGAPTPGSPAVARAVSVDAADSSGILGIMLFDDPAADSQPTIFIGAPGSPFTPLPPLPTTDGFTPIAVANDPFFNSGMVTVVGTGTNGTVRGIYVTTEEDTGRGWPNPTRIATLQSATTDFAIESIVSEHHTIWVGLLKPRAGGVIAKHSLYLQRGTDIDRGAAGQWSGAFPLPHSTGRDTGLVLAINPNTGRPHAAFTRVSPGSKRKRSGILVEDKLASGSWTTPAFVTHWYLDHADQMAIAGHGVSIIGYDQR
jgi:hypothetical protein